MDLIVIPTSDPVLWAGDPRQCIWYMYNQTGRTILQLGDLCTVTEWVSVYSDSCCVVYGYVDSDQSYSMNEHRCIQPADKSREETGGRCGLL